MMQIVIEISEEYYNRCKDYVSADDADYHHIKIANGIPLSKGFTDADIASIIYNSPTIIEADIQEVNDEKEETTKIQ